MQFIKKNLNPKGKKRGDCVVRAIAYAERNSWDKTFDALCLVAREVKDMPSCKTVYQKYLEKKWQFNKMPRFPDNTRYTVKEFASAFPVGVYIIKVANHLTVVENGNLIDTWDCSYKSVGNYWSK